MSPCLLFLQICRWAVSSRITFASLCHQMRGLCDGTFGFASGVILVLAFEFVAFPFPGEGCYMSIFLVRKVSFVQEECSLH